MLTKRELGWLHALQGDLALKRDWVAVGHIQSLIDHMADEHGLLREEAHSSVYALTVN
ncbi:hypothetical protein [Erythrobacter sp.]|uniref:hypothetical protein n=1 Tax=Erythrobacter sp. TaxID=1042 RepID=UPI0025EE13E5|nr:hypothetical protein [Erythrobacter sp.]